MMNAAGLRYHIGKGKEGPLDHLVIPIMGRLKGGTGTRHQLQAIVNKKASNLKVGWWM